MNSLGFTFISLKNIKVLFSKRVSISSSSPDQIIELPTIVYSDGRYMALNLSKSKAIMFDLFRKELKVVRRVVDQKMLVVRIDRRYPQAYLMNKDTKRRVLLFDELLLIFKNSVLKDGAKIYHQRDYSEAVSDDAVFGPSRERGHFVDIAGIEKESGKVILEDCLHGKILGKVSLSS